MVFQFEHMDVDADADNKWTDKKMDLREMKAVLTKWQKGLEDIAWTVCSGRITISHVRYPDMPMIPQNIMMYLQRCWQPVFT